MRANRGLLLGFPLVLAACADPMAATDGIMSVAGLAQDHNAAVHIINPHAGHGGANPGGSGRRAARVIDGYYTGEIGVETNTGVTE